MCDTSWVSAYAEAGSKVYQSRNQLVEIGFQKVNLIAIVVEKYWSIWWRRICAFGYNTKIISYQLTLPEMGKQRNFFSCRTDQTRKPSVKILHGLLQNSPPSGSFTTVGINRDRAYSILYNAKGYGCTRPYFMLAEITGKRSSSSTFHCCSTTARPKHHVQQCQTFLLLLWSFTSSY